MAQVKTWREIWWEKENKIEQRNTNEKNFAKALGKYYVAQQNQSRVLTGHPFAECLTSGTQKYVHRH